MANASCNHIKAGRRATIIDKRAYAPARITGYTAHEARSVFGSRHTYTAEEQARIEAYNLSKFRNKKAR